MPFSNNAAQVKDRVCLKRVLSSLSTIFYPSSLLPSLELSSSSIPCFSRRSRCVAFSYLVTRDYRKLSTKFHLCSIMAENGEEKLLAVARHIAKTLGHNESMADDILQIFSNFDGRFSREKLAEGQAGEDGSGVAVLERALNSIDGQISRFVASDQPIWADPADSAAFLDTIDELVAIIREWTPMVSEKPIGIEEEFRSLMERGAESFGLNPQGDAGAMNHRFDSEEEDDDDRDFQNGDEIQIPVAQPLTDYDLIIDALPSATINDLHEMAKRMIGAGFGKACSHVFFFEFLGIQGIPSAS